MNKNGIYKLTNKLNGKVYIGKSKNLIHRLNTHKYAKDNTPIHLAIKKYGWTNFQIEIVDSFENIEPTELLALEVAYIEYFQSLTSENGYNVCLFSNDRTGINMSLETKLKISAATKHEKNHFFGKKHTKNTRKLMKNSWTERKSNQTWKPSRLGKLHSQDTRIKQSQKKLAKYDGEKNPFFGKKHSDNSRLKMRISARNRNFEYKRSPKKIIQLDKSENVVAEWASSYEAAKSLGKENGSKILLVCKNKRSSAYGFKWKFV